MTLSVCSTHSDKKKQSGSRRAGRPGAVAGVAMDALCAAFPVAAGADPVRGRFVYAARDLVPGDVVCAVRRLLVGHRLQ
jgi:hypothetical protein